MSTEQTTLSKPAQLSAAMIAMTPRLKDRGWKLSLIEGRFKARNEKLGKFSGVYETTDLALEAAAALDSGMKMIVNSDGTTEFEEDTIDPTRGHICMGGYYEIGPRDGCVKCGPRPGVGSQVSGVSEELAPVAAALEIPAEEVAADIAAADYSEPASEPASVEAESDAVIEEAKASPAATRAEAVMVGESAEAGGAAYAGIALPQTQGAPPFVRRGVMLKLDDIRINGGTQPRAAVDMLVVNDYKELMLAGAKFPAVDVFCDGDVHWLADGFHRHRAAHAAEFVEILADVHEGTQRDAILFSLGANATHGLPRSPEDKRRAVTVLLSDKEWSKWSNHIIADKANVSHPFVGKLRKELTGNVSSQSVRKGRDGRQIDTEKIGKTIEPDDRQASLGGDVDDESAGGDQTKLVAWTPQEIVDALKRHGDALSRGQLEEMGCSYISMLEAVEAAAIAQPERGKFTLPDHKPQPTTSAAPANATATATEVDTDPEGWSAVSLDINLKIKPGKSAKRGLSISGRVDERTPVFVVDLTVADLEPMPRALMILISKLKQSFVKSGGEAAGGAAARGAASVAAGKKKTRTKKPAGKKSSAKRSPTKGSE